MRILICPDSFKGALAAADVALCIQEGLTAAYPEASCLLCPMADGGEGSLAALKPAFSEMVLHRRTVSGPLGDPVQAQYGWIPGQQMAIIEWAEAAGLHLIPKARRNALESSSVGVGELMVAALNQGARHIVLCLGGSATCDGGMGALAQLGFNFLDGDRRPVPLNGAGLSHLKTIGRANASSAFSAEALSAVKFSILRDVGNPLVGRAGAVVYAKQKGASTQEAHGLQQAFLNYARVLEHFAHKPVGALAGAGAAGGAGAGFYGLMNAELVLGADWIAAQLQLPVLLKTVDWVITGEGALDAQSLYGKVPMAIAGLARAAHVPVIALAGKLALEPEDLYSAGITAAFSLADRPMSANQSIKNTRALLIKTSKNLGYFLRVHRKPGPGQ